MSKITFFRLFFQTLQMLAGISLETPIWCKTCDDLSHYMGKKLFFC